MPPPSFRSPERSLYCFSQRVMFHCSMLARHWLYKLVCFFITWLKCRTSNMPLIRYSTLYHCRHWLALKCTPGSAVVILRDSIACHHTPCIAIACDLSFEVSYDLCYHFRFPCRAVVLRLFRYHLQMVATNHMFNGMCA